jgi:hypothetical protein
MLKATILLLCLVFSFSSFSELRPEKYLMVTVHGMGGYSSKNIDEIENVPEFLKAAGIERAFNAAHGISKGKFKNFFKNFNCKNGVQQKDIGLIIIGYSWGAARSYDLSKAYFKKCGRKADRSYMIDGIKKIVTQYKKTPIATVCKNYYKTISPIRGRALKGCENFDKTEVCRQENGTTLAGMQCHQAVLKVGYKLALEDIKSLSQE